MNSVKYEVKYQVYEQARYKAMNENFGGQVLLNIRHQVWKHVERPVASQVWPQVMDQVMKHISDSL